MFTLQLNSKTVGFTHAKREYVIGFKNVVYARKVQYNMATHPELSLVKSLTHMDLSETIEEQLVLDHNASLFITKCPFGKRNEQLHLQTYTLEKFLLLPYQRNLGIVMPYELIEETDQEFHFKSHVIDPAESITFLKMDM